MHCWRVRSFLVLCLIGLTLDTSWADELYYLGPGDHVEVKVSDFRAGTGEAYQWTAFSSGMADFIVGPSGALSLPVVGNLDASGKTTTEIEEMIATKLKARAGLATRPDASVQIKKFRPFYVVGAVDKPGEYEYRPGLTILQAVGIAGGMQRVTSDALIGFLRDALTSRGDLRVLAAARIGLTARQSRLDAEIANKPNIVYPDALLSQSADPDVARNMREEELLFTSRREGLTIQVATLERNKAYLRDEIESLQKKNATIGKQLVSIRSELALITGLVNKGLSAAPRQLALEQNIAQTEGIQLDVQVAIIRANEDISKSDRDILDLKAKRRDEILTEAADVRVKLAETIEKMSTSQSLVQMDEVRAPALLTANIAGYDRPAYLISRRGQDGKPENVEAGESDLVRPGDVVRVIPQTSPGASGAAPKAAGAAN
jgi:polysaccharide biosynthesis/export protein ExoF